MKNQTIDDAIADDEVTAHIVFDSYSSYSLYLSLLSRIMVMI